MFLIFQTTLILFMLLFEPPLIISPIQIFNKSFI